MRAKEVFKIISSCLLIFLVGVWLAGCRNQAEPVVLSTETVQLTATITPTTLTSGATPVATSSPVSSTALPPTHQTDPTPTGQGTAEASPTATTLVLPTPLPTPTTAISPTTALPTGPAENTPLAGQALVEALQRGGFVIAFRHTTTDQSQPDTDRQNLANCQTQRNLSAEGRTQAQAIGQAFQLLQIPVGQVLSSPYCRTLDTAQLAFGRTEISGDLLNMYSAQDEAERDQLGAALQQLLATPPAAGTNTILITHGINVQTATGLALAEGEAMVVAPDGAGDFSLIARVLPDDWSTLLPAGPRPADQTASVELTSTPVVTVSTSCEPTPPDGLGPFYVPNAPQRTHVGQGYILRGTVKSSRDCAPIAGAQLEFWLAGPDGEYSDAYRATMFANDAGVYQFESNFPPPYSGRPSHIHLRVTVAGYQTLVTQYYPVEGQTEGLFDLVLLPEN